MTLVKQPCTETKCRQLKLTQHVIHVAHALAITHCVPSTGSSCDWLLAVCTLVVAVALCNIVPLRHKYVLYLAHMEFM